MPAQNSRAAELQVMIIEAIEPTPLKHESSPLCVSMLWLRDTSNRKLSLSNSSTDEFGKPHDMLGVLGKFKATR